MTPPVRYRLSGILFHQNVTASAKTMIAHICVVCRRGHDPALQKIALLFDKLKFDNRTIIGYNKMDLIWITIDIMVGY
jgi:hypothetical protein